jgi:hypothetical protein
MIFWGFQLLGAATMVKGNFSFDLNTLLLLFTLFTLHRVWERMPFNLDGMDFSRKVGIKVGITLMVLLTNYLNG